MSGQAPMHMPGQGSHATYAAGFALALALTLAAYFLVVERWLADQWLWVAVVALALLQALVQLVFFFHLGRENRPYWNGMAVLFMLVVTVILVFGSLWIMFDLNERVMPMPSAPSNHQTAPRHHA